MKLQKQELGNGGENHPFFTFTIERIHIKVKFACRLYLEYQNRGECYKSREIRIDQKVSIYKIDEPIEWQSSGVVSSSKTEQDEIVIYVKLLSNKGLAFTAGVISVTLQNYKAFPEHFTLKLSKSLDFDAYCQCIRKELSKETNNKDNGNTGKTKNSPSSIKKRDSNLSSEQEKGRPSREPSAIRTQIEREESFKSLLNSRIGSWASQQKIRRTQSIQDYKLRQKELMQKVEDLQSEVHKSSVLFDRQKEIIALLQIKQREFNEEKTQFKSQIKLLELDIEDKRQKIRELQGQKLKLLMNTLQAEKELTTSKQKIGSLMEKVYQRIKRLFHEKSQKVFAEYAQKSPNNDKFKDEFKISLSKITSKNGHQKGVTRQSKQKEVCELSKMAFSAVRGLMNKEVDQAWLEESLGYPQNNPSSVLSNTLNDMSISNINGKAKEVSLLNSEFFFKPIETQIPNWSSSNAKNLIEEMSKGLAKLENMIATKVQRTIESFVEILEKSRGGKDASCTEESLLCYLEQLQSGFERQLGALGQKDRVITYYQQLIQELNHTLSEKQNLVVQLEEQLFSIEEEKDHIKGELHDANYTHSLKEEELMKKIHILQHGRNMPNYQSSASPTHKPQARRKEPKVPHAAYEQEIIEYKEHLRMMEIDLLHQRGERQKLAHSLHAKQLQLQQTLIEKRRLQFAAKIRERMASLNQSIQFSGQEQESPKNQQKFTQESLGHEEDFVNILIYQQ